MMRKSLKQRKKLMKKRLCLSQLNRMDRTNQTRIKTRSKKYQKTTRHMMIMVDNLKTRVMHKSNKINRMMSSQLMMTNQWSKIKNKTKKVMDKTKI